MRIRAPPFSTPQSIGLVKNGRIAVPPNGAPATLPSVSFGIEAEEVVGGVARHSPDVTSAAQHAIRPMLSGTTALIA